MSARRPNAIKRWYILLDQETVIQASRSAIGASQSGERLEFNTMPESLTVAKTANYADIMIPGRSEPYKYYSHSSATQLSLSLTIIAMGDPQKKRTAGIVTPQSSLKFKNVDGSEQRVDKGVGPANIVERDDNFIIAALEREVHDKLRWIEALTYEQVSEQGIVFPPPSIFFVYGQNFTKRGVLKNFSIEYQGPWEVTTALAYQAKLSMAFDEVNVIPKSYADVRENIIRGQASNPDARASAMVAGSALSGLSVQ